MKISFFVWRKPWDSWVVQKKPFGNEAEKAYVGYHKGALWQLQKHSEKGIYTWK